MTSVPLILYTDYMRDVKTRVMFDSALQLFILNRQKRDSINLYEK